MSVEQRKVLGSSNDGSLRPETLASNSKRIPDFIVENMEPIVAAWEVFARTLTPSADGMTSLALRDHIQQILEFVVADMNSSQTPKEQTIKSKGDKKNLVASTAAETHAALRLAGGFDVSQMVSEYRALRASIIKLWGRTTQSMSASDMADLTRFNEAIDQALSESVAYYTDQVVQSKDLFVGILSHDLRNPVQAIMLSTELTLNMGSLSERQTMLANNTYECASRVNALIDSLLDVTRARLGAGLPIIRSPVDVGFVANQIVDEVRVVHPTRIIVLDVSGDIEGKLDKARIGQVFSNLLSNAVQYSFKSSAIKVIVKGEMDAIVLKFHNDGVPIAPDKIRSIFDPLTRLVSNDKGQPASSNLGLGLYITKEIVVAHDGMIEVQSSEESGTTFTVRLPRLKSAPALHVT